MDPQACAGHQRGERVGYCGQTQTYSYASFPLGCPLLMSSCLGPKSFLFLSDSNLFSSSVVQCFQSHFHPSCPSGHPQGMSGQHQASDMLIHHLVGLHGRQHLVITALPVPAVGALDLLRGTPHAGLMKESSLWKDTVQPGRPSLLSYLLVLWSGSRISWKVL